MALSSIQVSLQELKAYPGFYIYKVTQPETSFNSFFPAGWHFMITSKVGK
jgi:hypothetical protein